MSQFESEDWHARKETADALVALMYHMGPTMDIAIEDVPLMGHISRALSAAKFDKVKPARDAVAEATAVARELTTYEGPKHDVARWRAWVRHKVGDGVGALAGDIENGGGQALPRGVRHGADARGRGGKGERERSRGGKGSYRRRF